MSETTLIAAVTVAVIFVVHVRARRSLRAADTAVVPMTGRGGRAPAGGSREFKPLPNPTVWGAATVCDLAAAEELLDWAEDEGYPERELIVLGNSTFLVRWRVGA